MSDAESIFFTALDKPTPAERDAYLDAACGDDADLRRRVERLLAAAPQVGSFLEQPPAGTGAYEPPADRRGELVGPYKLLQRLGDGGMGEVWMAEQAEPVKRRVAVKLVKPGMDSVQVIARFEAERQALAMMDHPNIAKVFDAGTTAAGRPYFVMELVKGVPLTAFCDDNHLTPRERLDLFVPVCQAVQHAHQKGVIHRDLKPSNVLVALYDGRPVPKVIDFGVAKALHQNLTDRTMFTEVGSVVGTLEYMSPEQAELNNLDIDTRSDVYSLGVMLYELLTGSRPLDAKRLRAAGFAEMLRIIREEEPPKPSTRISDSGDRLPGISAQRRTEPHKLSRLVRGDLDWIVMKALEKDRGRRYETANGFALDVQRYLADEPVLAGPPGARYRFRKFVQRNKGRAVAATLVLLALVAGTALATLGMIVAERQRMSALVEAAEAEAQRQRAEAAAAAERVANERAQKRLTQVERANEILGSVFKDLNPRAAEKDGKPLQALLGERLDQATAQLEGDAVGDPLAVAAMQMTLGESLFNLGHAAKAVELFTKAKATRTDRLGPHHPDTLASMGDLAEGYRAVGKLDQALKLYEQVLELLTAKLGPDHPDTLTAMNNLALGYHDAGKLDLALPLYEKVLAWRTAKLGPDHPDTVMSTNNLAESYRIAGKPDRAVPLLERAVALQTARLGPDHPDTLIATNNLALSYHDAGKLAQALALYEQVLQRRTAKLGPDHPDTMTSMSNLAEGYRSAGQFDKALPLLERAVAHQTARLGLDHPGTLTSMNNLALSYHEARRLDMALAIYERVVERRTAKLGPDHPDTLTSLNNLAEGYRDAGKLDQALALFERALSRQTARLGPDHPMTLTCMNNLALTYNDAGMPNKAVELFERVLERRTAKLGPDHPDTLISLSNLAAGYEVLGRFALALPLWQQSAGRVKAKSGADSPQYAGALARLGSNLLKQSKWPDAEAALRDSLAIRAKTQPDAWTTHNTKSLFGDSLLGQRKFADAEPLLLASYESLKQRADTIPRAARGRLADAAGRLARLYEATGKPEAAAKWLDEMWAWAETP